MEIKLKKISLYLLVGFMLVAGINHFIHPDFYLPLIPDCLPWKPEINLISGILEMVLAISLLSEKTRKMAALCLIGLMVLFIPSHIHFIQIGSCVNHGLCVPPSVAWIRLVLIHPLLMIWIFWHRK